MVLVGFPPKPIINPQVWSQREAQPITHVIQKLHTTFLKKQSHKPTPQNLSSLFLSLSLTLGFELKLQSW
jgi:hypothetical protein